MEIIEVESLICQGIEENSVITTKVQQDSFINFNILFDTNFTQSVYLSSIIDMEEV